MRPFFQVFLGLAVSQFWFGTGFAADDPFLAIKDLPERKFFSVGKYGQLQVADKDKDSVARIALSQDSPEQLKSSAVYALAISGYAPQPLEALRKIVTDQAWEMRDREIAAMGLQNFFSALSPEQRAKVRQDFRKVFDPEEPGQFFRTAIIYGEGPWIAEQLGDKLIGHPLEIEIDASLPSPEAILRLLKKYETLARDVLPKNYSPKAEIGRALIDHHDKRGIDILEPLLDAKSVPDLPGGGPSHQYRNNVFRYIQKAVGKNFGYEYFNYDPSIDTAIAQFRDWWLVNRYEFKFPDELPGKQ